MRGKRPWAVRLPKSGLARVVGSLVVVSMVAGITLGVTTLLGVTFQGSGAEPAGGTESASRPPAATICVQAVEIDADGQPLRGDPALETAAKSSVEAALVEVAKRPIWDDAGYAALPPVVDVGCPSPPLAVLGGPLWINGYPNDEGTPVPLVTQASFYRLFVFVMPSLEEIDRMSPSSARNRRAAQEFISANIYREGPTLVEVTSAVYVTPGEIESGGRFLSDVLAQGLGIGGP